MEVEELAAYADSTGITNVTLTGGEPLLQKEIGRLVERLIHTGHVVEIESNGSLPIALLAEKEKRPFFTLDYKLPDSGMESHMLVDNYRYLCQEDAVKFVAGSRRDLEKAAEIIETYGLCERCKVYLSPVFGRIDPADMDPEETTVDNETDAGADESVTPDEEAVDETSKEENPEE